MSLANCTKRVTAVNAECVLLSSASAWRQSLRLAASKSFLRVLLEGFQFVDNGFRFLNHSVAVVESACTESNPLGKRPFLVPSKILSAPTWLVPRRFW
jgi:hypothetical protein